MDPKDALRVISIYIAGIFVIVVGVLGLLADDQTTALLIMLVGLLVSALGGFYGRRQFIQIKRKRRSTISFTAPKNNVQKFIDKKLSDIKTRKKKEDIEKDLADAFREMKKDKTKKKKGKEKKKEEYKKSGICPVCMTKNPKNAKFCNNCGSRIK